MIYYLIRLYTGKVGDYLYRETENHLEFYSVEEKVFRRSIFHNIQAYLLEYEGKAKIMFQGTEKEYNKFMMAKELMK